MLIELRTSENTSSAALSGHSDWPRHDAGPKSHGSDATHRGRTSLPPGGVLSLDDPLLRHGSRMVRGQQKIHGRDIQPVFKSPQKQQAREPNPHVKRLFKLDGHDRPPLEKRRRGQCLTLHTAITSCWCGGRGVDSTTVWIFEMRDADTPNRIATVLAVHSVRQDTKSRTDPIHSPQALKNGTLPPQQPPSNWQPGWTCNNLMNSYCQYRNCLHYDPCYGHYYGY